MISIVTPTYNRAQLLIKTIESIQNQTTKDWELIIVDDGSTDNTTEVVQQYLSDSRIRYFKKSNSGATDTRNVGATYANGEYISFLDSDDEAFPTWLEEVYNALDEKTGLASVGAIRFFSNGTTKEELPYAKNIFGNNVRIRYTSIIVKRKIFNEINGFDVHLKSSHFTDICFRIFKHLENTEMKIVAIDKCLIKVNIHEGPRIRTNWKQVNEGSKQFIDKHYDFLRKHNSDKHISNIYSVIAFSNYKLHKRKESLHYLIKSIKHNPTNLKNYLKVVKYRFL